MQRRGLILLFVWMIGVVWVAPAFAQSYTGTVTASQLNVRTVPDPIDGVAIARVFQGQVFEIIGRDERANWFQIRLPDGNSGWVSSAYFRVPNLAGVPVTNADYITGTVLSQRLNVRNTPNGRVLFQVSRGQGYRVLSRTSDGAWYEIRHPSGTSGFVAAQFLQVPNPERLPVVNTGVNPAPVVPVPGSGTAAQGTVVSDFLNIRTAPDPVDGVRIATASGGDTFAIIGRDATANWWQIQLPDGNTGWVSSAYFRTINTSGVPVTNADYVQGTVTASFLNLRAGPTANDRVLGQISRNQAYRVVGKNSAGTWYEIRLPSGVTGWVNGSFLSVSNPGAVPVTRF